MTLIFLGSLIFVLYAIKKNIDAEHNTRVIEKRNNP